MTVDRTRKKKLNVGRKLRRRLLRGSRGGSQIHLRSSNNSCRHLDTSRNEFDSLHFAQFDKMYSLILSPTRRACKTRTPSTIQHFPLCRLASAWICTVAVSEGVYLSWTSTFLGSSLCRSAFPEEERTRQYLYQRLSGE